jgi:hypothetical protein
MRLGPPRLLKGSKQCGVPWMCVGPGLEDAPMGRPLRVVVGDAESGACGVRAAGRALALGKSLATGTAEPPGPGGVTPMAYHATRGVGAMGQPLPHETLQALRRCANRGQPFGDATWQAQTAAQLGLTLTFRPRGRPRKAQASGASK